MLIGELARRSGVPAKTLRFYEEAGVLPQPERTGSGYRDYDEAVLDRLAFVRAAQAAGLTLAEIRDVIGLRDDGFPPCSHVAALIETKAEAVARQIQDLRSLQRELERLSVRARELDPASCDPLRVCDLLAPDGDEGRQVGTGPRRPDPPRRTGRHG